jgi:hypothetical protein
LRLAAITPVIVIVIVIVVAPTNPGKIRTHRVVFCDIIWNDVPVHRKYFLSIVVFVNLRGAISTHRGNKT